MKYLQKAACYTLIFLQGLVFSSSCIEPFNPRIPSGENNILIVEGYIRAGSGKSTFKLSRTVPVGTNNLIVAEENAIVSIVSSADEHFPLPEVADGIYESADQNLPTDQEYELNIRLTDGSEYVSQRLPVKVTPVIDDLRWEWTDAIDIYVSSHNSENNTRYYQFDFKEDWQIRSQYQSLYKWDGDTIVSRPAQERNQMYNCWKSASSKGLIIYSTTRLESDNVDFRLTRLPQAGERTSVRYSILVNQHALTEEHFNYLTLMQKNTTQVGSFFDPMPSEIRGNIVNVNNPDEMIVGYVGSYTSESKRMFINNYELPSRPTQDKCATEDFKLSTDFSAIASLLTEPSIWIPVGTFVDREGSVWLTVMEQYCLDCRLRGSSTKPDFW
jgi:hypothetical protein